MKKFFQIEDKTVDLNGITFNWPLVKPTTGLIDVVREFQWKNRMTKKVDEVPSIFLTEYTLPYGKWLQSITNLFVNMSALQSGSNDPYGRLYEGILTGFTYNLPYLVKPGNTLRGNIKNSWSEVDFKTVPFIGDYLSKAEKFAELFVSGYGFEKLSSFSGTSKKTIDISFPLYNTVSLDKTISNFWFITLFGLQNLKIRTTYLTYIPPKIYKVEGVHLGGVYMPAAIVSSYRVESIGATRSIDIGEGYNVLIPEAYKVTISLQELISDSTNIMRGSIEPSSKVQLIQILKDSQGNPIPPEKAAQLGVDNALGIINFVTGGVRQLPNP